MIDLEAETNQIRDVLVDNFEIVILEYKATQNAH